MRLHRAPPLKWGLMATESLGREDIEAFDMTYLAEDSAQYDAAEAFVLLGSAVWTEAAKTCWKHPSDAHPALSTSATPTSSRHAKQGSLQNPELCASLGRCNRDRATILWQALWQHLRPCLRAVGKGGHGPHIDGRRQPAHGHSGGQAAGLKTALIADYGFFAGHDVADPIAASRIEPDYILKRP